jgi:signal transduction histidine kinase
MCGLKQAYAFVECAHVDISQIKRQHLQLAKLNHELSVSTRQAQEASHGNSQFLVNMSHHIRPPMNVIVGPV